MTASDVPAEAVRETVREAILGLTTACAPAAGIWPSEMARRLGPPGWRALRPVVPAVATGSAANGRIGAALPGRAVDPAAARGPIRRRAAGGE